MNSNHPTLMMFEAARREAGLVPPEGSNSFYSIGEGEINLLVKRADKNNYRFRIFTNKGHIYTGPGNFIVAGDINDIDKPYEDMTIISGTTLSVNNFLTISKGKLDVHGTLELMQYSQIIIRDGAQVTFYIDSTFDVKNDTQILIEKGSSLTIYGKINVHLSRVDSLINSDGVIIDSAAVMNVEGMDSLGERPFSMADYDNYLRDKIINVETQGEINTQEGRLGYTWVDGSPIDHSQLLRMSLLWGESILGDFKFSILGTPEKLIPNLQIINELIIEKSCILYISEEYKGKRYIRPDLYIGVIIGNNKTPGKCVIDGKIIVDGKNSFITVDRGASIYINEGGELWLNHGSSIRSTHNENDDEILFINGTLYMEDIEQISSFTHDNIVIGDNGKVVIFNPDNGNKRILWSTPHGIEESMLYALFKDRIDHVEYHISNNTGIAVDEYYEFYARQFTQWYGGRRIEKAIHDGILVWHHGGFIELNQNVIPWVTLESSLLHAARLFKTFGSYDHEKLQEAVERLQYAGAGNIVFRFVVGEEVSEVTMTLDSIHMKNIVNHPMTSMYQLTTDNDGLLFMRNKVTNATPENIIHPDARSMQITGNKLEFPL